MGVALTMSTSSSSTSTSTSTTATLAPTTYLFIMIIFLSFSNIVLSRTNTAEMLLDLKRDFENTGVLDSSWINGTNPCHEKKKWAGVVCKNGKVRNLRLTGFNLRGKFTADAIANLTSLRTINIGRNQFSGPIPDFYLVEGVTNLYAYHNKFNGEISPMFFGTKQASKLRIIDISSNDFSGKIPDSLASSVPNLKELQLHHNGFTGPVPLFQQQLLWKLDLSFNKLEGEIPDAMIDKFGAGSFAENPRLCSPKIGKECNNTNASWTENSAPESSLREWFILGVIIVTLLGSLSITKNNNNSLFTSQAMENKDHAQMHVHKLNAMSWSRTSSKHRTSSRTSSINRRGPLNRAVGSSSWKLLQVRKKLWYVG